MANYPTKYLFIAETEGLTSAARELNALQKAMQGVNAGSGATNLAKLQKEQASAAAALARQRTAEANTLNAVNRAQIQGIKQSQQAAAANTQEAISIQKIAKAQADRVAAESRASIAQAKAAKALNPPDDPNYIDRFVGRFRSAFAYTVAFTAIGGTFAAIGGSVRAWVDAQIQLNNVVADSIILLGRSAEQGERFADVQRSLSFVTGQQLSEIAPSSMMAERVGQPELAVSAAQWSMVVGPQLQASETVDDLRALSIQFGLSMEQINNGLLATLQNSGIAADQLFDLSASFGVFAGQLGLGESERDLREIAGLFAALSNITGQTTPTLQNFVRRMADEFYDPNAALRQQLEAAGIQTVTKGPVTTTYDKFGNMSQSFEEIRRPFTEIFAEISVKGPAAIKAFSTAIDNSLGQPTQSQFILIAENWDKVSKTIGNVVSSTADFSSASDVASKKLQTALDRIGIGFTNLLSVIGSGDDVNRFLTNLGSALQNFYDRFKETETGYTNIESIRYSTTPTGTRTTSEVYEELIRGLERKLESAYGDNYTDRVLERRAQEITNVMRIPGGMGQFETANYIEAAISQFLSSKYFDPGDNGASGAQSFKEFEKLGFNRVAALREAYPGMPDNYLLEKFDGILTETEKRVLRPWNNPDGSRLASFAPTFSTQPTQSFYMSQGGGGLRNMMLNPDLARTFGSPFEYPSIALPKDVTPGQFDEAYDEVSAILSDRFGPAISQAEVELIAFSDETSGLIAAIGSYNTDIARQTVDMLRARQDEKQASDNLVTSFYDLAGAAGAASVGLGAILSRARIELPEGVTTDEWKGRYRETEETLSAMFGPGNVSDKENKSYIFMDPSTGMPASIGGDLNPDIVDMTNQRFAAEKIANDRALAEQKAYQSKALSSQEAYQSKMLGAWNGMVSELLQPSAVTGTDLFYNSPRGTYNDNWDEPVRRMKADVNNTLSGKPLEYGWGGLAPYMNMDAVNMAMGATQQVKEAILRSEEARVSEQFYNMELPWEAYSGNTDAIIANAQAWIGRKQQKNANMANVQQLLVDAGLGPDAEAFVKAMEEPPILRAMFGGKSADEINTTVTEAVTPDMTAALAKQAASTSWSLTIATAIQNDVTNNYEVIVAAGKVIGQGLAKGSASQFAAAIIPLVLAAISGKE